MAGSGTASGAGGRRRAIAVAAPSVCCGSGVENCLEEDEAAVLAEAFSALGDPVRLRLLSVLAQAEDGAVCVCDLVPAVDRSQPTVSHHLRILSAAGLVEGERRGKWVWYSLNRQRLADLQAALDSNR